MNEGNVLILLHLFGLALAVGAATVKFVLAFGCRSNSALLPVFVRISKPVTRIIVLGMLLLILSGFGWLLLGYASITPLLAAKIVLVVVIMVLGPYIDKAIEPRLAKLSALPQEQASPELPRIQRHYLVLETVATGLLYAITVVGILV
jgi:hypothetical protein